MINIVGEKKKPNHWPGASLKHFGTNPAGESLYRVVWAGSRNHIVGGRWKDRSGNAPNDKELRAAGGKDYSINREVTEYRWVPLYPGTNGWVLERWLSAREYTGCSPANYELQMKDPETGLLICGPYPEKGEFMHCYTFPAGAPQQIETIIQMIERSRGTTFAQKRLALQQEQDRKDAEASNKRMDIFNNAQGPFGGNPVSGIPGKKTTDQVRFKYAAEDLGMPVGDNKFFQN